MAYNSFFLVGIFNSSLHHNSIVTRTVGITGLSNFVPLFIHMMTFNPGGDAWNANRCHAFKTTVVRRVFLNLLLCTKCASLERLQKVRTLRHTMRIVAFDWLLKKSRLISETEINITYSIVLNCLLLYENMASNKKNTNSECKSARKAYSRELNVVSWFLTMQKKRLQETSKLTKNWYACGWEPKRRSGIRSHVSKSSSHSLFSLL